MAWRLGSLDRSVKDLSGRIERLEDIVDNWRRR